MYQISSFPFLKKIFRKTDIVKTLAKIEENQFRLGSANPVISIMFYVTEICNYSCRYCHYSKKTERLQHAFNKYTVNEWVHSFNLIPFDYILDITGGEPFLDAERLLSFLEKISSSNNCKIIRINTNGSCLSCNHSLDFVSKEKIRLNISYHPSQIRFDEFCKKIRGILDYGLRIDMINYVMEVSQVGEYEKIRYFFKRNYDIYVNPNPDLSDMNKFRQRKICSKYLYRRDLLQKTGLITFGKRCFFPSIGFILNSNGEIYRGCINKDKINFIEQNTNLRPEKNSFFCPKLTCGCLDMYAFLVDFLERGRRLDLLREYIDANMEFYKVCF